MCSHSVLTQCPDATIACSRLGPFCVVPVRLSSCSPPECIVSTLRTLHSLHLYLYLIHCLGWILPAASHCERIGSCRSCRRITVVISREKFWSSQCSSWGVLPAALYWYHLFPPFVNQWAYAKYTLYNTLNTYVQYMMYCKMHIMQ